MTNKYVTYRSQMQTGDLLEFASHSFIGWAIRKKTGKDVNHTAMVYRFTDFDTTRIFLLEALANGITINVLSRRLLNFEGEVYWLPLKECCHPYRKRIGREGLKYSGVKYDYGSILKQLSGRVSANLHKLFCSEFAYFSYVDAHVVSPLPTAPRPGEMCDLGCFESRIRIL